MAGQKRVQRPTDSGTDGQTDPARERAFTPPEQRDTPVSIVEVANGILALLGDEVTTLRRLRQVSNLEDADLLRLELVSKILKNLPEVPRVAPGSPVVPASGIGDGVLTSVSEEALERLLDGTNA